MSTNPARLSNIYRPMCAIAHGSNIPLMFDPWFVNLSGLSVDTRQCRVSLLSEYNEYILFEAINEFGCICERPFVHNWLCGGYVGH